MRKMREAGRSDKSIRNYVGVIRALFNFAMDKRRRWCSRNPADDVDLPKNPTYTEIRYLTTDEVWLLVDHAQEGEYRDLDRALYLTAAMEWMGHPDIQTTQRYADYCPNPGERSVVEAAFARGSNPGNNLPTPAGN